jgi:hypothetical protein
MNALLNLDSVSPKETLKGVKKVRGKQWGHLGGSEGRLLALMQGALGSSGKNTNLGGGYQFGLDGNDKDAYEGDDLEVDEDEDDGGSVMAELQPVLAQMAMAQEETLKRRRAAHSKVMQRESREMLATVKKEVALEVAEVEGRAKTAVSAIQAKVAHNAAEQLAVKREYEAKMSELKKAGDTLAVEAHTALATATRRIKEARLLGKRKLQVACDEVKTRIEEGRRAIQRATKRARSMRDMLSVFIPLLRG